MNISSQVTNQTLGSRLPWEIGEKGTINFQEQEYLNPEQLNKVGDFLHEKSQEKAQHEQEVKSSVWQSAVQSQYVESQKQALDAYIYSATGNTLYDDAKDNSATRSLTETYLEAVKLQQQMVDIYKKPVVPPKEDDVTVQPLHDQTLSSIGQYQSVQTAEMKNSSLLHLMA